MSRPNRKSGLNESIGGGKSVGDDDDEIDNFLEKEQTNKVSVLGSKSGRMTSANRKSNVKSIRDSHHFSTVNRYGEGKRIEDIGDDVD